MAQKGVETAFFSHVRKVCPGDVERNSAFALGRCENALCRHVKKARIRIDETADEPGARYAVDLRPFARHPTRGPSIAKKVVEAKFDCSVFIHVNAPFRRLAAPKPKRVLDEIV
jgi:hypothetical protein